MTAKSPEELIRNYVQACKRLNAVSFAIAMVAAFALGGFAQANDAHMRAYGVELFWRYVGAVPFFVALFMTRYIGWRHMTRKQP